MKIEATLTFENFNSHFPKRVFSFQDGFTNRTKLTWIQYKNTSQQDLNQRQRQVRATRRRNDMKTRRTFAEDVSQRQESLWDQHVLKYVPQLLTDAQTGH